MFGMGMCRFSTNSGYSGSESGKTLTRNNFRILIWFLVFLFTAVLTVFRTDNAFSDKKIQRHRSTGRLHVR